MKNILIIISISFFLSSLLFSHNIKNICSVQILKKSAKMCKDMALNNIDNYYQNNTNYVLNYSNKKEYENLYNALKIIKNELKDASSSFKKNYLNLTISNHLSVNLESIENEGDEGILEEILNNEDKLFPQNLTIYYKLIFENKKSFNKNDDNQFYLKITNLLKKSDIKIKINLIKSDSLSLNSIPRIRSFGSSKSSKSSISSISSRSSISSISSISSKSSKSSKSFSYEEENDEIEDDNPYHTINNISRIQDINDTEDMKEEEKSNLATSIFPIGRNKFRSFNIKTTSSITHKRSQSVKGSLNKTNTMNIGENRKFNRDTTVKEEEDDTYLDMSRVSREDDTYLDMSRVSREDDTYLDMSRVSREDNNDYSNLLEVDDIKHTNDLATSSELSKSRSQSLKYSSKERSSEIKKLNGDVIKEEEEYNLYITPSEVAVIKADKSVKSAIPKLPVKKKDQFRSFPSKKKSTIVYSRTQSLKEVSSKKKDMNESFISSESTNEGNDTLTLRDREEERDNYLTKEVSLIQDKKIENNNHNDGAMSMFIEEKINLEDVPLRKKSNNNNKTINYRDAKFIDEDIKLEENEEIQEGQEDQVKVNDKKTQIKLLMDKMDKI